MSDWTVRRGDFEIALCSSYAEAADFARREHGSTIARMNTCGCIFEPRPRKLNRHTTTYPKRWSDHAWKMSRVHACDDHMALMVDMKNHPRFRPIVGDLVYRTKHRGEMLVVMKALKNTCRLLLLEVEREFSNETTRLAWRLSKRFADINWATQALRPFAGPIHPRWGSSRWWPFLGAYAIPSRAIDALAAGAARSLANGIRDNTAADEAERTALRDRLMREATSREDLRRLFGGSIL